ncbi:amidohydrolase [Vibrio sp. T187]|uniref:amidohydrolase n=1 Tax=Vibrio TaxID=662 RepID=UPI0010C9C53E|nr:MULTISPECIES: amidohydrolase [Vibrio]MBW3696337.1 amidohydrolase [Vibrio sp. T187]
MKKSLIALVVSLGLYSHTGFTAEQSLMESVQQDSPRLVEIFEGIHANPEIGFMEFKTAELVASELTALGFEVHEGIARTGVAGVMKNGDGPVVMFRADMDALPIKEQTALAYSPKSPSKDRFGNDVWAMHACGHDAHTTWLIGMAKQLVDRKDEWKGTVVLVAQPAEEMIMGATAMVDDGLYDRVPVPDILIAGHTHPVIPEGSVAISDGRRMAGTDQIDVTIQGVGGHGSTPHASKDPVVMAAMSVIGYQTVVSRMTDQSQPAVLTVGAIETGSENNIIPDSATLKLNLRWYRTEERDAMLQGIKQVTDNVARMYGMPENQMPSYEMKGYSTPVINPVAESEVAENAMKSAIGEGNVMAGFPPVMGSEDFHMLSHPFPEVPIVYVEVGAAKQQVWDDFINEGALPEYINHNPKFVVEQGSIPTGTAALTSVVLEFLD